MKNRTTIINELKDISPLIADLQPLNPYSVPYNYFEQLPDNIRDRILEGVSTVPHPSFPSKQPFTVPEGYFDNLAGNILKRIHSADKSEVLEETRSISSIVAEASRTQPFTVPAGYFDTLADKAVNHAKESNSPRVVSMNFSRKVFRYAAAAVLTGVIVVTAFLFIKQDNNQGQAGSTMIDNVSLNELENYLSTEPVETSVNSIGFASSDLSAEDIKEFIHDISDEGLQQYVNQNKASMELIN